MAARKFAGQTNTKASNAAPPPNTASILDGLAAAAHPLDFNQQLYQDEQMSSARTGSRARYLP